jgi:hypothetical protein
LLRVVCCNEKVAVIELRTKKNFTFFVSIQRSFSTLSNTSTIVEQTYIKEESTTEKKIKKSNQQKNQF